MYLVVFSLMYTYTLLLQNLVSLGDEAVMPTEAELGRQEVCELSQRGKQFGGKQCNSFQCGIETECQEATKGPMGA